MRPAELAPNKEGSSSEVTREAKPLRVQPKQVHRASARRSSAFSTSPQCRRPVRRLASPRHSRAERAPVPPFPTSASPAVSPTSAMPPRHPNAHRQVPASARLRTCSTARSAAMYRQMQQLVAQQHRPARPHPHSTMSPECRGARCTDRLIQCPRCLDSSRNVNVCGLISRISAAKNCIRDGSPAGHCRFHRSAWRPSRWSGHSPLAHPAPTTR